MFSHEHVVNDGRAGTQSLRAPARAHAPGAPGGRHPGAGREGPRPDQDHGHRGRGRRRRRHLLPAFPRQGGALRRRRRGDRAPPEGNRGRCAREGPGAAREDPGRQPRLLPLRAREPRGLQDRLRARRGLQRPHPPRPGPLHRRPREDRPTPELDDTIERLPTSFDLCYTWNYETLRQELKNLYEKAKRDQWNATDQLPWATSVDPEAEIVPDFQIPVYDTHIWQKMTPAEIRKLRRESLSWTLSQFMHGEQGALLATAQITTATPWIESKFYAASQVMDEARHVEVYSRYLREKLSGAYPINRHLKTLLDQILTDSRWDMKYLGMQIMVEGLAMAAFGYMHKLCQEPLLTELTHYVMRDEARHVAFGLLSPYVRERFAELGILQFENEEPSA